MLVAAAVCPHPPLLVPALGVGLGSEIAELRDACAAAVTHLHQARPDVTFVVGADIGPTAGSFEPWGAAVIVDVPEPLPLPLLVGAYLTRGRSRSFVVVESAAEPDDCAALGAELAEAADRVALLIMGDGSARHDEKAPGYVDARAPEWDESVHVALVAADTDALLRLDPALGDALLCAGRPAWQVLAGAAHEVTVRSQASLSVPFGVGYHVARWEVIGRN